MPLAQPSTEPRHTGSTGSCHTTGPAQHRVQTHRQLLAPLQLAPRCSPILNSEVCSLNAPLDLSCSHRMQQSRYMDSNCLCITAVLR